MLVSSLPRTPVQQFKNNSSIAAAPAIIASSSSSIKSIIPSATLTHLGLQLLQAPSLLCLLKLRGQPAARHLAVAAADDPAGAALPLPLSQPAAQHVRFCLTGLELRAQPPHLCRWGSSGGSTVRSPGCLCLSSLGAPRRLALPTLSCRQTGMQVWRVWAAHHHTQPGLTAAQHRTGSIERKRAAQKMSGGIMQFGRLGLAGHGTKL